MNEYLDLQIQSKLQDQVNELRTAVNDAIKTNLPPPAPSVPMPCCTYCGVEVYAKFKVDCYWFCEERFCEAQIQICRKDCFVNGGCEGCSSYISISEADKIINGECE